MRKPTFDEAGLALLERRVTDPVTIQNLAPRRDIDGDLIDCHDGCLRGFGDRYYLFGTCYGETDGFTTANFYVCYSSPDLSRWTAHGRILSSPKNGVYYRPYVVFNRATKKYVLWFNWYPQLWHGQFGVALAERPEGPYHVVNDNVRLRYGQPGDHNLFVDDDGAAYIAYTSILGDGIDRHAMSVERLTPDFTASTLEGSSVLDHRVEAPAMFKRDGRYYVVFGETCCFCPQGSDARVFIADRPLGPYRSAGDINRGADGSIIVPAQQTDIAQIRTANGNEWLWIGDLWGSRSDGIKGHDIQYWSPPLRFNGDGSIAPLTGGREFTIAPLPPGSAGKDNE